MDQAVYLRELSMAPVGMIHELLAADIGGIPLVVTAKENLLSVLPEVQWAIIT